MVVHSISATTTPPRPSTTSFLAFRMKQRKGAAAGLSSARRALSLLGNNNAKNNLRLAESLLTITQDKFMNKWNFDPVKEAPMVPGRFQWASVSSIGAKSEAAKTAHQESSITAHRDISTCFTLPSHRDISTRVPEPHSPTTTTTTVVVVEADSGVESDDSVIEDCTDTKVEAPAAEKQTTITDYLNPRKRSSSHLDDSLQLPNSKKRQLLAN